MKDKWGKEGEGRNEAMEVKTFWSRTRQAKENEERGMKNVGLIKKDNAGKEGEMQGEKEET